MRVGDRHFRTIWETDDGLAVEVIDQTRLPHAFETARLRSMQDAAHAIKAMIVRGAPLIGATAAYGVALQTRADASDAALASAYDALLATRPTAVNLRWALDRMRAALRPVPLVDRFAAARAEARRICDEDAATNETIGDNGLALLSAGFARKGSGRLNVLTHCNAGWLACVDWGTALAPIYKAHEAGLPLHVWVDETRPRNQGASLTAWELGQHGVPHTVIVDNAGGHLMQRGEVDLCVVGADRVSARGDVCNKIGTYLKALAAHDNRVPFYVALPSSTIDWTIEDGVNEIPIERRAADEVAKVTGKAADGSLQTVSIIAEGTPVANYGFDVTPARYVTALVTERGVCKATADGLARLFHQKGS